MNWELIIAGIAAAISLIALGVTVWNLSVARHEAQVNALQGEKEAVSFVALQVSQRRIILRSRTRRKEMLQALCLAAVYEKSGRSRVMIYDALEQILRTHAQDVHDAVRSIEDRFKRFEDITDLDTAFKRLDELKAAVELVMSKPS
jgi:hypothetical protein